jgi:hypothetical protein
VDSQATSKVTAPTEGKRRMRMVDRKWQMLRKSAEAGGKRWWGSRNSAPCVYRVSATRGPCSPKTKYSKTEQPICLAMWGHQSS